MPVLWAKRRERLAGVTEAKNLYFQADHCLSTALGGTTYDLKNRCTACQRCNIMKGALAPKQFLQELRSLATSACARLKQ